MDICKHCKREMVWTTWAEKKRRYGKLKRLNYDEDSIKDALPRCDKCLKIWIKNNPKQAEIK